MAYKVRAYPNPAQAAVLARTFGCVRVVWNRTLAGRHARWATERRNTSYRETDAALTAMKRLPELAFLGEVSSVPLQQTLRHQHNAFQAFFAGRAHYPRYKSRRGRQSAHSTRGAFRWRDGRLWLAKTNAPLVLVWSWPDVDPATLEPTTVTVSRDPDGRWYATLHLQVADQPPLPATGRAVGIDLGLTDLVVTSDGRRIANPRHLERKAANLARAIADSGWGAFRQMLAYKAERAGRRLVVVDRFYPSSKTCSGCGHLLASLSLRTQAWQCPSCGARHDRDLNAAKNILAAGLAVTACGADVSHAGSPRVQSAVKQEPSPATERIPVLRGGE